MTEPDNSPDLAALRQVAEAATPGPWQIAGAIGGRRINGPKGRWVAGGYDTSRNDAAFIAACDPPTILALLDRLEAAERERDEARADLRVQTTEACEWRDRAETIEPELRKWQQRASEAYETERILRSRLSAAEAERDELQGLARTYEKVNASICDKNEELLANNRALQSRLDAVKALAEEWDNRCGREILAVAEGDQG